MRFAHIAGLARSRRPSLPGLVLLCAGMLTAGCQADRGPNDQAAQVSAAMLEATQRATAGLKALAAKRLSADQRFDAVNAVTESHIREVSALGERFNALPFSSRRTFRGSPAGARHEQQMNDELARMKALAYELLRNVPTRPLAFGQMNPGRMTELLQGTAKWPSETRQAIDARHGFARTFLLGVSNFSDAQRTVMLARLDDLRRKALEGDGVATAELNGILEEIIRIYPKDEAAAQYNLGVLYADTENWAEAERWLSKAASRGLPQAAAELERVRRQR